MIIGKGAYNKEANVGWNYILFDGKNASPEDALKEATNELAKMGSSLAVSVLIGSEAYSAIIYKVEKQKNKLEG